MRTPILFVLLWLPSCAGATTFHKCTSAEGAVSYSNTPCAGTETAEKRTSKPAPDSPAAQALNPDGTPVARLNEAGAVIESVVIDGRNCSWALKVTKDMAPCRKFADVAGAGSRFEAARATVLELLDDNEFAGAHQGRLSELVRMTQEVVQHLSLLAERLRT